MFDVKYALKLLIFVWYKLEKYKGDAQKEKKRSKKKEEDFSLISLSSVDQLVQFLHQVLIYEQTKRAAWLSLAWISVHSLRSSIFVYHTQTRLRIQPLFIIIIYFNKKNLGFRELR